MIWIDSSFAVEWLGGTPRAAEISIDVTAGIQVLPMQYAEICAYFYRRDRDFAREILGPLRLVHADANDLQDASMIYVAAREQGSKASLADAVLAATVRNRGGLLYAFDEDFRSLGMRRDAPARWVRA